MHNSEYDPSKIGARIKDERAVKEYTQSDLADAIGLSTDSRQTVGKWESGKQLPRFEHMLKMCKLFDCELGYLLCEYDQKTRTLTDISQATGLSPQSVEALTSLHTITNYDNVNIVDNFISSKYFKKVIIDMAFIKSTLIRLAKRPRSKPTCLDDLPHGMPVNMLNNLGERQEVVDHLLKTYGENAVLLSGKASLELKKYEIKKAFDAFLDTLTE